jgi:hypothetical protein
VKRLLLSVLFAGIAVSSIWAFDNEPDQCAPGTGCKVIIRGDSIAAQAK